jgi:hypothetical protein
MTRFSNLKEWAEDSVERLVAAGVSRTAAERAVKEAEDVAVLDLIETEADRRLLDLFEQYGSAALAERKGLCQKTISNRKNEAAERLARKKIGRRDSDPLAA